MSTGVAHHKGTRNAPSLLNAAYNSSQFWDGRRNTLEDQILDPLFNPLEHGLTNEKDLIKRLKQNPQYRSDFEKVFRSDDGSITIKHVRTAIAAYERTLLSGNSAFDRYYYGHEQSAISASAKQGLALFQGRAGCSIGRFLNWHPRFSKQDQGKRRHFAQKSV